MDVKIQPRLQAAQLPQVSTVVYTYCNENLFCDCRILIGRLKQYEMSVCSRFSCAVKKIVYIVMVVIIIPSKRMQSTCAVL